MALAARVNDFMCRLFLGVGIRLVDFQMECDRLWENDLMRIVVADEAVAGLLPAPGHQVERARQGSFRRDLRLARNCSPTLRAAPSASLSENERPPQSTGLCW